MMLKGIRNKIIFLFTVITLSGIPGRALSLNGQAEGTGDEEVFVHTSKPVYVAGEMLRYRVYTFNKKSNTPWLTSRILYFVLTDYKGNVALQWRINLNMGNNSGSCRLPADLKAGVYTLAAYTSQMRNDSYETLNSQNIIISSLSHEFPDTLYIPDLNRQEAFSKDFQGNSRDLSVETRPFYNAGDSAETIISLNKELPGDTASVSVSVFLSLPFANTLMNDSLRQFKRYFTGKGNAGYRFSGQAFPVENKNYILSGTLKRRSGNEPIKGGRIILAVIDSLFPHIRYSRTDSSGRFVFYLDKWFDNREIILQRAGDVIEGGLVWEIDRKELTGAGRPYIPYTMTQTEINSVTTLNESRLIESVYNVQAPVIQPEVIPPGANYFSPPDMMIRPGDYSDLVNFREITENILQGVRFVSRGNTFAVEVFNEKTGQWPESDMILMNGVPFYDMNYIATLGTKDISRLEVIKGNYMLGDLTLEGLVSIYTNDRRIPQNYLKNRTFIIQNSVVSSDKPGVQIIPEIRSTRISHDPDFRVSLLWEPAREIAGDQKLVLRFPVSLISGTYDVIVNGITQHGIVLSGKTSFEVK